LQHPCRSAGARFLLLVFALLAGVGAAPAGADPDPSFLLEKISVAGNRRPASARIVVSESLLKEGRSYAEDDLRAAIRRIKRLPFIIEADFALKKGTARGRYELVVSVEETRPIFADLRSLHELHESSIVSVLPSTPRRIDFGGDSLLGFREFVGSTGLVFATVGSSHGLAQAGYTRYDLFGDGSFASLALAYDPNRHTFTPTLSAGAPLTVNQSLRATVSGQKFVQRSGPFRSDSANRSAELDWLYNTTDDPLFPTQGNEAEADLVDLSSNFSANFTGMANRFSEHVDTFTLSGRHHQRLTALQSWSFGLTGATYRYAAGASAPSLLLTSRPSFGAQASLEVGHGLDIWPGEPARRRGNLRLETTASYVVASTARGLRQPGVDNPVYQLALRANLVYRNPWAVVRLGVSYSGKVMR
jgi:hypothetical protein